MQIISYDRVIKTKHDEYWTLICSHDISWLKPNKIFLIKLSGEKEDWNQSYYILEDRLKNMNQDFISEIFKENFLQRKFLNINIYFTNVYS